MEMPTRKKTIEVELEEGLKATFRTLSNKELAAVWEESEVVPTGEAQGGKQTVQLRASPSAQVGVAESHLLSFSGDDPPTFDGQPFKPGNPDHISRLKPEWLLLGGSMLVQDAMMPEETAGNSGAPAASSPEAETPSPTAPSVGASHDS